MELGWHAWLTLLVVLGTVAVLALDRLSPAATVLGATVLLLVAGVISPEQALAGFSNAAPISVAALYVLARAVEKTGGLQPIVAALLRTGGGGGRGSLARLLVPSAAASAFLNNTPIVAMLVPLVRHWADRHGHSPSRFLMPLSFAVILGGVITAIGTSTNLVVSGLMQSAGMAPLGMFELTRLGLPVAIGGVLLLVVLSPWLLTDRRAARDDVADVREFVVGMRVAAGGPLEGVTVEAAGLRHLQGVFLVEIERAGLVIAPVAPAAVLEGGDYLVFVGKADLIVDLQAKRGLVSAEQQHVGYFDRPGHTFFEAVIGAASPLVGRTLKEAEFRGRYQAAVVAIHRSGQRVRAKLGSVRLRVGDTLLLLADPGFRERWRDRNDFLLVSQLGGTPPAVSRKAGLAGAVILAVVVLAGAGVLPILQAALVGAVAVVALGVLTPGEARGAVDLDVIILIAASFGLGAAIERSGLAAWVGHGLTQAFGGLGVRGGLLGVVLATILLTEVVTNNAAAALMFPVGLAAAQDLGIEPRGVAMAIAVAASASFLTPIGYQTNTMVYGPGGYRFTDYARLGFPLTVGVVVVVLWLVPVLWPR